MRGEEQKKTDDRFSPETNFMLGRRKKEDLRALAKTTCVMIFAIAYCVLDFVVSAPCTTLMSMIEASFSGLSACQKRTWPTLSLSRDPLSIRR